MPQVLTKRHFTETTFDLVSKSILDQISRVLKSLLLKSGKNFNFNCLCSVSGKKITSIVRIYNLFRNLSTKTIQTEIKNFL